MVNLHRALRDVDIRTHPLIELDACQGGLLASEQIFKTCPPEMDLGDSLVPTKVQMGRLKCKCPI